MAGDYITEADHALVTATTWGHVSCMQRQYANGAVASDLALLFAAEEAHYECIALTLAHGATKVDDALKAMVIVPMTDKTNYSASRIECAKLLKANGATCAAIGQAFVDSVNAGLEQSITRMDLALAELLLEWGVSDAEFGVALRCTNREAYRWGLIDDSALLPDDGMCEAEMMTKVLQTRYENVLTTHSNQLTHGIYATLSLAVTKRETDCILRLLAWFARQHRKRIHSKILEVAIAMSTTCLPPYVLLWITDWIVIGPLSRKERVAVLEGVRNSIRRLRKDEE